MYLLGELVHPGQYTCGDTSSSSGSSGGSNSSDDSGGDGGGDGAGSSSGGSGGSGSSGGSGGGAMPSTSPILTLSTALQKAGGLKETADVRHIRISRLAPKQTFDVDLWKLMIDGDVSEDKTLQPGDVVYVPKGGADFDPSTMGVHQ